ncbi:cytochrome c oxidase accessory protein CcoG [Thermaurantiacus sp.]
MNAPGSPTTGEPIQFFEKRRKVYPKKVEGPFRRLKWLILFVTLGIYYVTPWIRWDRGPYAPDQAVLVDIANRRFFMGPIEIWPQEFYYVAGLLIMAGIGLFLITSTVGRAWCGYACPQTVWTDLFMAVERWIEGDRNARMKLDREPWGPAKIMKRVSVHAIWLLIAVATGGAWVFYFTDAPTLLRELVSGTAPFAAYAAIGILTFTTYTLAGLMREQVCTYMCPWPRIQSAMLDEDSFIVTYKAWRGEPRGSVKEQEAGKATGDCVDCMACVNVCPTGIDIRNGPQLECITCALCIDACNDVMTKLGRPNDLIGYSTLNRDRAESRGETLSPMWKTFLRPRTLLYFAIWAGIGLGMLGLLAGRDRLDITVAQDRNPIFVQMSGGEIRNGYTVKVLNKEARPRSFTLSVEGLEGALIWEALTAGDPAPTFPVRVRPDGLETLRIFVKVPADRLQEEQTMFRFVVTADEGAGGKRPERADVTTRFTGPPR